MEMVAISKGKRRRLSGRAPLIPRARPNFSIASVLGSLRYGRTQGSHSRSVESAVAARIGVRHVVLTPSGRGGLFLLLHCLPPGRVCVPGYTCSAISEAASLAGREIAYQEHSPGRINLSAEDIEGKLQPGDIFVMTHQYGYSANVSQIVECARRQGATIVEDIAAAFAGTCGGKPLGSFGLASFGSFDTSKLVHVPLKGGFVATDDDALAIALRAQASHLFQRMSVARMISLALLGCILRLVTKPTLYGLFHAINFRLRGRVTAEDGISAERPNAFYTAEFAEWQAAIALPQLHRLDDILGQRGAVYGTLLSACTPHSPFRPEAPVPEIAGASVRFPVYAKGNKMTLYEALLAHGVDCGFSFTRLATPRSFVESWRIADSALNLPYYFAMTPGELESLATILRSLGKQANAETTS